ncbi:Ig-like domain repeat protein [Roseovarius sp. LXJ103]|uniref:Ig-like domain-containing protein n=1 Tax=Roseovarius carneus TaxID=2853164 RepID=UPI000D6157A1|nr:Ig-like domain-containing protein [Roseovarius carneus]MBZ8119704.1 Ig-like domain repeat protein [Roseovarius carneus]PWE34687.1 RTX toxin [Pelagicola sp. LXJ1103]
MKVIDFVVRTNAGATQYGSVSADGGITRIDAGSGEEISLNLRQMDIVGYSRSEDNLQITLADGRVVVLENYFNENGDASRLFISADGYLNEVTISEGPDGVLYSQYGPTAQWGKWSPSDDLIFLDGTEVAGPADIVTGTGGDDEVSMLGIGALLGGSGLLGAAGAGAAAVVASQVIEGGDGGGGGGGGGAGGVPTRISPSIDQSGTIAIGGDGAGPTNSPIDISGKADPGSKIEVMIGGETEETVADENGDWDVTFEGGTFPPDGTHVVEVKVTEGDGRVTDLTGPNVTIDTTPPVLDVTDGTVTSGDVTNADEMQTGVSLSGTGEAGATIEVTIDNVTRETTVTNGGTWSVLFENGSLRTGEYDETVTIVSRDAAGNSTTITETVRVDTVANEISINTATIEGDGIVNAGEMQAGIDVTGTATPGSTVIVTLEGVARTVTANDQGQWTATYAPGSIAQGQYDATVVAQTTDAAGNFNTTTGTIRVDTFVENFTMANTAGGADSVINASEAGAGLVVNGTGEPGSSVMVRLGTVEIPATVQADGSWTASFTAAQIPAGTYTTSLAATATDGAGNTSTVTQSVQVDTDAGALNLNTSGIAGDGTINLVESQTGVVISGRADPGALVKVTLDGAEHDAIANGAGVWQTLYQPHEITGGVRTATVTAMTTDAAGNSTDVSGTVNVDTRVDNLNLSPPRFATSTDGSNVINGDVASSGFDITGTVEPGSTATVSIGGVAQTAIVQSNGDWTASFPGGAIRPGEYDAALSVAVTDRAGNTSSLNDTIRVDTNVNTLARDGVPVETDGVINASEAMDGVTLGGQVEAGSTVSVDVFGRSFAAVVANDGTWTLDIPGSSIPVGDQAYTMVVNATDGAGNTRSLSDTLVVDTIVPDQPDVVAYDREAGAGYRSVSLETPDSPVEFHQVTNSGAVREVNVLGRPDPFFNETEYNFLDAAGTGRQNIPDGSQLIVTSSDAAGNASSTYLVLDETSTNVVDLGNANLSGFQIETIDLRLGDRSQLTLTESQIESLSNTTDTVVVRGGADDRVTISGAQRTGSTVVDNEVHSIYTLGDSAQIIIDQDIEIIT